MAMAQRILSALFLLVLPMAAGCGGSVVASDGTGGTNAVGAGGSHVTIGTGGTTGIDAGGSSGTEAGLDAGSLAGLSFNLSVDVGSATRETGVLHVLGVSGATLSIVFGTPGHAETGTLTRVGTGYHLDTPLTFWSRPADHAVCDSFSRLVDATFTFAAGSDASVSLALTGTRSSRSCSDDTGEWPGQSAVTGIGTPDETAPALSGPSVAYDPLTPLALVASEPLRAGATALLASTALSGPRPLDPVVESSLVVGFKTDLVLPLGAAYLVSPSASDLAGNSLPALDIALGTPADPGVLSPDGFESGWLTGVASLATASWPKDPLPSVVTDLAGVSAIAGAHSLYVPSGGRALLHLQRSGAETKVVLKLRKLEVQGMPDSRTGSLTLTAGVVLGTGRSVQNALDGPTIQGALADGTVVKIGDVQDIVLPIADAGADVLVEIAASYFSLSYTDSAAALIDDVHLE
jgi:hypothetical protein